MTLIFSAVDQQNKNKIAVELSEIEAIIEQIELEEEEERPNGQQNASKTVEKMPITDQLLDQNQMMLRQQLADDTRWEKIWTKVGMRK